MAFLTTRASRDPANNVVEGENPMYKGNLLTKRGMTMASGKKKKIAVVSGACILLVGLLVFFLLKKDDEKGGDIIEDQQCIIGEPCPNSNSYCANVEDVLTCIECTDGFIPNPTKDGCEEEYQPPCSEAILEELAMALAETTIPILNVDVENLNELAAHKSKFGYSVATLDMDGEAPLDMVVGAPGEDSGGSGAVYLVIRKEGKDDEVKRLELPAGLELDNDDNFGRSVAALDVNGDDVEDIVVGSHHGDDRKGAVYVFTLDGTTGGVATYFKLNTDDALDGEYEKFGSSLAKIEDLTTEPCIAVGAKDAIFLITLQDDTGTIREELKISEEGFGSGGIASLGVVEGTTAIVAAGSSDQLLFVSLEQNEVDGSITNKGPQVVQTEGKLLGTPTSIISVGDMNDDLTTDIAVGTSNYDQGRGGVSIILLSVNNEAHPVREFVLGDVKHNVIADEDELQDNGYFGRALATFGDVHDPNNDNIVKLAIGSFGKSVKGAVYITDVPYGFVTGCETESS